MIVPKLFPGAHDGSLCSLVGLECCLQHIDELVSFRGRGGRAWAIARLVWLVRKEMAAMSRRRHVRLLDRHLWLCKHVPVPEVIAAFRVCDVLYVLALAGDAGVCQ